MCILLDVILLRPSPPISFTVSRVSDRGGVFDVTALANSSDMTTSEDAITAFIFKVEYESETRYILQVKSSFRVTCGNISTHYSQV